MNIKDYYFEDFIGVFDTDYDTRPLIEYWKYQDKCGSTFQRYGIFGKPERKAHTRKDRCLATEDFMLDKQCGYEYMQQYNLVIGSCLEKYVNEYEALMDYRYQQVYLNVQRTKPGEGYHSFHFEKGSLGTNRRVAATMMYLNTVEEGGETEFLYQHKRFKPVAGQVLIWPAGFTHVHRGLPPLKGEKYIATSWLENVNA
jgi:hypothetical protein